MTTSRRGRIEQVTDAVCVHGEGVAVSPRWAGPRWVDMLAGDILELVDGTVSRRHVGTVAALIRPRRSPGFVVATELGIALTDADDLDAAIVLELDLLPADGGARMNEGECSPDGALFIGSMDWDAAAGGGTLLRIGPDLSVATIEPVVTISNGLAWDLERGVAYYVDSPTGQIDVLDSDPTGAWGTRRAFAKVDGPDGLCLDADGAVWVACFGAGEVRRYLPDGTLDTALSLPTRYPTSVGLDGTSLYITTSRHPADAAGDPVAGSLLCAEVRVPGRPIATFAG